jgi:succinate dehydrogenase hydrophobic anchor subunit
MNLAGMLIPPIGLFLILPLAIHQSQFIIRVAGLFLTPLSGIIFIGARALLFMSVAQTHASWHSRVNGSVTQLILIKVSTKQLNNYKYLLCMI